MLGPDTIDRDAPIGAARLRKSGPRKAPLARKNGGGAWKPFAGAAAIALVAAGLATMVVQAVAPSDADRSMPAPARQATAPQAQPPATMTPPAPPLAVTAAEPARIDPPVQAPEAAPSAPVEPSRPAVAAVAPSPEPPSPPPAVAAAPAIEAPAAADAVGAVVTGALKLSPQEVLSSLERGEAKLKTGDVAAARRYFERAALAGDARGATAMGRTYDPEILARLPVIGLEPDPAAAATWYDKARTLKAGP